MSEEDNISSDSRPIFGNRYLTNDQDVFKHNAWDDVTWDDEQEHKAQAAVMKNSEQKVPKDRADDIRKNADQNWDNFYALHQNRFFKDRHWLFVEFPELNVPPRDEANAATTSTYNIFELGCGVGNTLLPVLQYNNTPQLRVYGCDFSARAIELFLGHHDFDATRCEVFVMDATLEQWTVPFAENSMDVIVLIFVLSAIEPPKMQRIAENCSRYLRPGGTLLFRDYGRYDLAQVRFKDGKCLEDNCYVRGDSTMVYFFQQEEVRQLFTAAGLVEESNIADRRLQVHRGRKLKMYRVWISAKFKKPISPLPSTEKPAE